jgi:hypothetical protein
VGKIKPAHVPAADVASKLEQLGMILADLAALCLDPANVADFARHEAALSTTLTKPRKNRITTKSEPDECVHTRPAPIIRTPHSKARYPNDQDKE